MAKESLSGGRTIQALEVKIVEVIFPRSSGQ
jgi:hypothetical protein